MASAALKNDALLPRPPGGLAPGAMLALLVHAGLITALTLGIDWRSREPEVVSAELWSALPQTAAPPPAPEVAPPPPAPAPPPAPVPRTEAPRPDADIALEQKRKQEADRRKAEAEEAERQKVADRKLAGKKAAEKAAADKTAADKAAEKKREADKIAREKAETERIEKQREENLRRMMGQAGGTAVGTAPTGTAAQNSAPSASYAGKVKAAVRPNIVFTGTATGNAAAEVEVNSAPGGTVLSRRLVKSSGNKDWDEAVLRAIDKTPAMPRDTDGRVPASLLISFRPNE